MKKLSLILALGVMASGVAFANEEAKKEAPVAEEAAQMHHGKEAKHKKMAKKMKKVAKDAKKAAEEEAPAEAPAHE